MTDDTAFARLVSLAVHDVRTPLATVSGFARTLAKSGALAPPSDRSVEMIEAGRYDPAPRPADTLELARAAAARLGEERVHVSGEGAAIETDAEAVERGVAALVQSAFRHGGLDEVAVVVRGTEIDVSPVTDASAPVVLGEDLRALGAAVAVRLVERLGGSVTRAGETLTIRLA